ncbi:teratocarcinoma-derived growth factor-like [Bufo gargarizans]|uniref:teratocarcinoma-derived growth factor-like n=1 Tax=Bufo gargarizans TaxID=30331 RepID=UPI001CF1D47A|nr:teratocarcinoma-derived growth factor-like [Bufo gargarizans]
MDFLIHVWSNEADDLRSPDLTTLSCMRMSCGQFLVSIIVSAECFITFTYGKSCKGLFCHQVNFPQTNLSSYITQPVSSSTSESPSRPANKVAFQGILKSHKLNKKCCYNGGTCFLGTFCICPKEYTGRRCEYEKRPQNCAGGIANGEWVVRGCALCRCFSGELYCLPPAEGCEHVTMRSVGSKLHYCCVTVFGLTLMIIFALCALF